MKKIINFILAVGVLFGAWQLFPEYIEFGGIKDVIIVCLIMSLIDLVFLNILIFLLSSSIILLNKKLITFTGIFTCIIIFIMDFVEIWIANKYYDGFSIAGDWKIYLCLCLAFSFFSLKETSNNKKIYIKKS